MAYRSHTASPCESASPSSSSSSTHLSPYSKSAPLEPMTLNDDEDSGRSTSQPRTQNAGKGGCWYVLNNDLCLSLTRGITGHAAFDGRSVKTNVIVNTNLITIHSL